MSLFQLGQLVATPGAIQLMQDTNTTSWSLFSRHMNGDWGCVCKDDAKANNDSIKDGLRILSVYKLGPYQTKVYVITEADRSSTCILLPSEY